MQFQDVQLSYGLTCRSTRDTVSGSSDSCSLNNLVRTKRDDTRRSNRSTTSSDTGNKETQEQILLRPMEDEGEHDG
jgi:hypothetical protein